MAVHTVKKVYEGLRRHFHVFDTFGFTLNLDRDAVGAGETLKNCSKMRKG